VAQLLAEEGYHVECATDGREALDALRAGARPQLILLDLMLPRMSGFEFRLAQKTDPALASIPVIAMTANTSFEAAAMDVDAVLTKPIGPAELLSTIERTLTEVRTRTRMAVEYHRQMQRWRVVARVADAVGSARSHDAILGALREGIFGEVSYDAVELLEIDEGGGVVLGGYNRLGPAARAGDAATEAERFAPLRQRQTIVRANLSASPWECERALAPLGLRGLMHVPLYSGGDLVGALTVARATPFDDEDVRLLEAIAGHLGHAIANVRARLRMTELATLKERMSLLLVHDLKNPLSIIKVNLDLLEEMDELDPEECRDMVADARAATQRMWGMILDLLDIGRAEENRLQLTLTTVMLDKMIADVANNFRAAAQHRNVHIRVETMPGLAANVDAQLMQRVLENIVSNALRYTRERGEIAIGASASADRLHLSLENEGPTIPEALRARLFQKYGQLGDGTDRSGTRGLGLYFCRLVVEAHGGTIRAVDRVNGGPRFEITLPRA
jgi:signal transduction histidine kinase